jgi:polyferredoxin/Fe-S-cluster-containing hydrogenase component 2
MSVREVRVVFSIIIMVSFLIIFTGGEDVSTYLSSKLTVFQFTPSLIKFIYSLSIVSLFGLLFILILTFIFGRVYCSFLCPLGIMQDAFIFLSKKLNRKRKFHFSKYFERTRYLILTASIVTIILGSAILINLLDPYSIFGRIATNIFKPAIVFANNILASVLEQFDIYAVFHKQLHNIPVIIFITTFVLLTFIFTLSLTYGRAYCNSICPVGTFLGIISKFSLLKISITEEKCNECQLCEYKCKASCIDARNKYIDMSRCINCFDCFNVCKKSAIKYQFRFSRKTTEKPEEFNFNNGRRGFLRFILAGGTLFALSFPFRNLFRKAFTEDKPDIIIPPGSISIEHFGKTCLGCHLCVSSCPSNVLKPALLKNGIYQPILDYQQGFCEYDCNTCGKVCPTGAITNLPIEEKKLTQIGEVKLVEDYCVVFQKNQDCGACAEICPTHAVYTVERNNLFYPETNSDYCIGCGACEYSCPETPKAIVVTGKMLHTKALEPFTGSNSKKYKDTKIIDDEFPF